jgi:hypothetical protein
MPAKKPTQIYQIKITLRDSKPPIWRRVLVPADVSLARLHDIIQTVMGWADYHLHVFTIDGVEYGDPVQDAGEMGYKNEGRYRLSQFVDEEGFKFDYEYDFGDGWEHVVLVEKILPEEKGQRYPVCIKGKRACPPEDVGGVWGYEMFLEAIKDPKHEEHASYLEWVGGSFDPEQFDLDAINARLKAS